MKATFSLRMNFLQYKTLRAETATSQEITLSGEGVHVTEASVLGNASN